MDKRLLNTVKEPIRQGFSWATREGPLCEERKCISIPLSLLLLSLLLVLYAWMPLTPAVLIHYRYHCRATADLGF